MTNWQNKYNDLKVFESAWYWHRNLNSSWFPVQIKCIAREDEYPGARSVFLFMGTHPEHKHIRVSEDFPNGPKCLTPDEIIELTKEVREIKEIFEDYRNKVEKRR